MPRHESSRSERQCIFDAKDYEYLERELFPLTSRNIRDLFEERLFSKLKVDQLKKVVKYLRDVRGFNVTSQGRKSNLIETINDVVYPKHTYDTSDVHKRRETNSYPAPSPYPVQYGSGYQQHIIAPTSPPSVSPTFIGSPVYYPTSSTAQPTTYTTTTSSRVNVAPTIPLTNLSSHPTNQSRHVHNQTIFTQPSTYSTPTSNNSRKYPSIPLERVKTDEERRLFIQVNRDRTLGGMIDCFSDPEQLLDVKTLRVSSGKTTFQLEIRQNVFNQLTVPLDLPYQLQFHLFTELLKPKNWNPETSIYVNNVRCEMPKINRKLTKKTNKNILISSTPTVAPRCIRSSGWIEVLINSPINGGILEGILVIMLCRMRTIDELIDTVRSRSPKLPIKDEPQEHHLDIDIPPPTRPTGSTPGHQFKVEQMHNNDEEDDDLIMHDIQVVPLKDPVSMDRIEIPAKGMSCVHRAVFDLATYLHFGASSHTWNCPCCDKPLPFHNLIIDPVMEKILHEVSQSAEKIILHKDGSYEIPSTNTSTKKEKIEKSPTTPTNLNSTTEDLRLHTPPLDIIDDDVNEQFNGEQTSPPLLSHEYLNNFNFSVNYDTLQGSPPIINFINNNQSYQSGNTIDDAIEID
jgi:hypothetical protein